MGADKDARDFRDGEYYGRHGGFLSPTPESQAGRDGYAAGLASRQIDELRSAVRKAEKNQREDAQRLEDAEESRRAKRLREKKVGQELKEKYEQDETRDRHRRERWLHEMVEDSKLLGARYGVGLATEIERDAYYFARKEVERQAKSFRSSLGATCREMLRSLPALREGQSPVAPKVVFDLVQCFANFRRDFIAEGYFIPFENLQEGDFSCSSYWDDEAECLEYYDKPLFNMSAVNWVEFPEWISLDSPYISTDRNGCWLSRLRILFNAEELKSRRGTYSGDDYWVGRIESLAECARLCESQGMWNLSTRWLRWQDFEGPLQLGGVYGDYFASPKSAISIIYDHRAFLSRITQISARQVLDEIRASLGSGLDDVIRDGDKHSEFKKWLDSEGMNSLGLFLYKDGSNWAVPNSFISSDFDRSVEIYSVFRKRMKSLAGGAVIVRKGGPGRAKAFKQIFDHMNCELFVSEVCKPTPDDGPLVLTLRKKITKMISVFPSVDNRSSKKLLLTAVGAGLLFAAILMKGHFLYWPLFLGFMVCLFLWVVIEPVVASSSELALELIDSWAERE